MLKLISTFLRENFSVELKKILSMASGRNFVFYAKEQVWLVICVGNAIYGFIKDVEWGRTKTKKSKDYCKADLKQHILFFITIFRLAIPAFFRFTDVTELMGPKMFERFRFKER